METEDDVELYQGDVRSFYSDMAGLVNNKQYSDVKFLVGNDEEIMYGHKCILATRCQFFKKIFDEMDPDAECFSIDISPEDFSTVLEFIYTNCCSKITRENIFDLLSAADKYGLNHMIKICEDFLLGCVCIEKACESVEAAVTFNLERLLKEVMLYFEANTTDIFRRDAFKEMSAETVAYILQSNKLHIDEYDIYLIVKDWATVNSVVVERPVGEISKDVAQFIRLPLLTPEELSKIESHNDDLFIPVEQISQAWKHLALKTPLGSCVDTTPRRGTRQRASNRL